MENLETLTLKLDNLTQATGLWLTGAADSAAARLNLSLPELDMTEAVVAGVATVLVTVFVCFVAVARLVRVAACRLRAQKNARIVEMAEYRPEDDEDELEYETRGVSRTAAPGDSDLEEDTVVHKTSS